MKKGFRLNYKVSWWENGTVVKKKLDDQCKKHVSKIEMMLLKQNII